MMNILLPFLVITSLLFPRSLTVFDEPLQSAQTSAPIRRVNVPYASVKAPDPYPTQMSITWFGKVDRTRNYADVRTIYDDEKLTVAVHIIDRLLWYDQNPSVENLEKWDAVTLYLSLDEQGGSTPTINAHRFVAQLNHSQPRPNYQAAYQGNGSGWQLASTTFETSTSWRGTGLNDLQDDRGWYAKFSIPFSSLGFSTAPPIGTTWRLAVILHDRDDQAGTPISDNTWPEGMSPSNPSTWGELVFGVPTQALYKGLPGGGVMIRQGWNGLAVKDAHVGGHTVCGDDYSLNYFDGWGDANYASNPIINIQNQWDIADWPCFSRYYVTFPLDSFPQDKEIASARLTLHQFGNAWGGEVEPSYIQVLTIGEDWEESRLTWNNAPLAIENITGTWVEPLDKFPGWPGVPRHWDVSRAVAEAYQTGEPLRLALYSADGAYHSGRYFSSSDVGDWNATARPTLTIRWRVDCNLTASCTYLPSTVR
jgi:hypothetical protein